MNYLSAVAVLPIIAFLAWFWAIHTGTGIFRFAKDNAWLGTGGPGQDASEEYLVNHDLRDSVLRASVLWGAYVALSSEILSLARLMSRTGILAAWGLALLVTVILIGRAGLVGGLAASWEKARLLFRKKPLFPNPEASLFILILLGYISVTLLIALVAPPNTNDSLQYHMTRVMHWLQNRSLEHYATPGQRQIWMPIWAETAILHLFALAGSDRLSNLVQWFSMIVSLTGVSLIAAWLGASRQGQLMAAIFAASIPMGVLQSTSTQNDYVNACWAVCLAYFILRILRSKHFSFADLLLAAFAAGLGNLTKGIFITFSLPFLAALAVFLWQKADKKIFTTALLTGIIIVSLTNAGFWIRNFKTYQNPLGPSNDIRYVSNEVHGIRPFLSNLLRNAAMHFGETEEPGDGKLYGRVAWFHRLIQQDISDPKTSMNEYSTMQPVHEDFAGNAWHFAAITATIIFLLLRPILIRVLQLTYRRFQPSQTGSWLSQKTIYLYAGCVLVSFLLFSLIYKWQHTGTRLQLPFFVLWAPLFGVTMEIPGKSWLSRLSTGVVILLIAFSGVRALFTNPSRFLFNRYTMTSPLFERSRLDLLFLNNSEIKQPYLDLAEAAKAQQCKSIGLSLDSSNAEYPLWALLSPSGKEIHFEHLYTTPELSRYIQKDPEMCAIICSVCKPVILGDMTLVKSNGGFELHILKQPPSKP